MMKRIKHLYIHVPFCNAICFYCDFCRVGYNENRVDRWLFQVQKEIEEKCADQYETIYIGGGTPSCLTYTQLDRLLTIVDKYSKDVIEYTIEANPESLSNDKIDLLVKHHINRVSLGVQTTDDKLLSIINRRHSFEDVKNVVYALKSRDINNITVDLMYSLPSQTLKVLNKTIEDIMSLDIPHISIYSLTIEDNSVFGIKHVDKLDDELESDMYELIIAKLKDNGYINYEVSNFSKPGHESKHNLAYWKYEDFLGISCGAASKIGNHRYQICNNILKYLEDYHNLEENLYLEKEDMMFENIMMSLRTIYGLDINEFNQKYDCDFLKEYENAIKNPLISIVGNIVKCSNLALLNNVLLDFME